MLPGKKVHTKKKKKMWYQVDTLCKHCALSEALPRAIRGANCTMDLDGKCCMATWFFKGGFHETTNINEINHRCIKIGRQVTQTCRHRPMEIGAVLAAD